jgi:hypothetical protein
MSSWPSGAQQLRGASVIRRASMDAIASLKDSW